MKIEQDDLTNIIKGKITSLDFKPVLLKDVLDELSNKKEIIIEERKANILFERIVSKMDFDKEVNKYLIIY